VPIVAARAVDGELNRPEFISMMPAPRTPDTQQVAATRGVTRDLSQQRALAFSVAG
jgi:hypothetical protein